MSREMSAKSVRILYIGRLDPNHETLWAQLHREGTKVEFASTQQAGHTMALASQPQIVVINTTNGRFSGERLCRTLGRRLPSTLRLLISEAGASVDAPCEMRLNRPFTVRKLREAVFKLLEQALPAAQSSARRPVPTRPGLAHPHRPEWQATPDAQAVRPADGADAPPQPGDLPQEPDGADLGHGVPGGYAYARCARPLAAREDRACPDASHVAPHTPWGRLHAADSRTRHALQRPRRDRLTALKPRSALLPGAPINAVPRASGCSGGGLRLRQGSHQA